VFETYGDATSDSRFVVFSATKAFVAAAVWTLIAEGAIDVRKRVVDFIPEFGTNGKDVVTVEQVMLHTSGFPHAPLGSPQWYSREGRIARFAAWRLNWEPGTAYEYHATSAHWVLAEIIDRVTGADYRDVIEQRITAPLGLPRVLGVSVAAETVATPVGVGEPPTADELEAVLGIRALPVTEVTQELLIDLGRPEQRELGVPGGGGVMRASDLALFYQGLLHDRAGIWDPALLADVTGTVRNDLPDRWTGIPAKRTLGLITAGDDGQSNVRGFGRTVSPRAFGHNGARGQIAWADPESGISFAYVTNGLDEHLIREGRRGVALSSLAAVC
jgi:CubicO group peptidase (beta-lactamase class C family)